MKCSNCGFENMDSAENCVNCGFKIKQEQGGTAPIEAVSLNPAADAVLPALRDRLFFALCILMTVSCGMSLFSGALPVIDVLITIFLWLTYTDASKNFANANHLRFISGAVYASYIVTNVASIIVIIGGVIFAAFYNTADYIVVEKEVLVELEKIIGTLTDEISSESLPYIGIIVGVALIITGIITLVFNILCMQKVHRFAQSVYTGIMYQNIAFYRPRSVKNWLIFLAVCNGISAVSALPYGLLSFSYGLIVLIPTICTTAATIIAVVLLNKYFVR